MSRPRPMLRGATARSVLRPVAVLLLLLGILAMHQLAGGDHMSMSGGTAASAPRMTAPEPAPRSNTTANPVTASPVIAMVAAGANGEVAEGRTGEHGAMPLCLAVLAGLFALVLPVLARRMAATPADPRVVPGRTRPPGRGPPRDLLAELCVLRT